MRILLGIMLYGAISQSFALGSGDFFEITESGSSIAPTKITLSLNPLGPMTTQKYEMKHQTLTIRTVTAHSYVAGIRVKDKNYLPSGCTPMSNGFCSFAVSNVQTATVTFNVLTPSVSTLALSVNAPATNSALTGNPRQFSVTNTGTIPVTHVRVSSENFPTGTSITANTCSGTLAPNASCTITVTPGENASSSCNTAPGSAPSPGIISISSDNTPTSEVGVVVLGYGCIYQGGYVFSINDSLGCSCTCVGSTGGKVVATTDQSTANGEPWDADPACATFPNICAQATGAQDFYIGLNAASVPGSTNPSGTGTTGPGNTYLISSILNGNNGDTNTPPNYAAGVCVSYQGNNYSDWYLPAICEMGNNSGTGCAPEQNIDTNLLQAGFATSLTTGGNVGNPGSYWSSTENAGAGAATNAWGQYFSINNSAQGVVGKQYSLGVRCTRVLN